MEIIRKSFESGMASSRDPLNVDLPDLAARITTIYSLWYTLTCPECKQSFREGDRVRICPLCEQAYHDDDQYNLRCWHKHFIDNQVCREDRYDPIAEEFRTGCPYKWNGKLPDEKEYIVKPSISSLGIEKVTSQFLYGVTSIWKPYGEEKVLEVKPGNPIIGHKCPWCRFQIRTGDRVVKCPCNKCNTYFHNDIFRHLTCWNDWNGARGMNYCPTTGDRIVKNR